MYTRSLYFLLPLPLAHFSGLVLAQPELERIVVSSPPPQVRALENIAPLERINIDSSTNLFDIPAMLSEIPDISLNGQGGMLQSVSLRGFSRWRVQTMLEGVPINTDRRAGTAAEFVDPAMLGGADILYGSASTYLGSNAIGGGVDLRFASPQARTLRAGFRSNQSATDFLLAHSVGDTDMKVSFRHAANGSAPGDGPLFDEYRQSSVMLRHASASSPLKESWTLFSDGRDIGKSTRLFPDDRVTRYPQNRHWLGKLTFQSDTLHSTHAEVYWHQSRLLTDIERIARRRNHVDSEALDYGARIHHAYTSNDWQGNVSLMLDGRSGVRIRETEQGILSDVLLSQTSLDAKQQNLALVVDGQRQVGSGRFVVGGRVNWQRQQQQELTWADHQFSGFVAYARELSQRLSANIFIGSAFRTPTLTERFFNGETPRGRVIGDINLDTEHAVNVQSQLRFEGERNAFELNAFQQRIEDYIERIVDGDLIQYRNLSRADVRGISYRWTHTLGAWRTEVGGQWLNAEDDQGGNIADISPDNHDATLHYATEYFNVWVGANLRLSHNDVASGEVDRPSHLVWRMGAQWQASPNLGINLQLHNLTNRQFFTTQDEDAPLAQGRDLRLAVSYLF